MGGSALFFPQTEEPAEGAVPDAEAIAERLAVLGKLSSGFKGIVLTTALACGQPVPEPKELAGHRLTLVKNTHLDRDAILQQLQDAGYTREAQVQERGQFSVRGAVVDVFPGMPIAPCGPSGRTTN